MKVKKVTTGLRVWNYFKNSWEDSMGQLSYRRVSQYIFLACMIRAGFKPPVNNWEFYVFITFACLYALVAALITAQQLIELLKFTLPVLGRSTTITTVSNEQIQNEQPPEVVQEIINEKTGGD